MPATEDSEGAGTRIKVPTYLMQGLKFRIADRNVTFVRPVPVLPKATDPSSEVLDGVFGLDILDRFQALTINYQAMRIVLM